MLSCHSWKVLLAIVVSVISLSMLGNASNVSCPTWFYFNNNTQQCECGALKPWGIRCNQREMKVEVANGYCISYLSGQYYAGDCYYAHLGNFTDRMYSVMSMLVLQCIHWKVSVWTAPNFQLDLL